MRTLWTVELRDSGRWQFCTSRETLRECKVYVSYYKTGRVFRIRKWKPA